jgi:hypothetical protein
VFPIKAWLAMKIYDDRRLELPLRFPPSMATLERDLRDAR